MIPLYDEKFCINILNLNSIKEKNHQLYKNASIFENYL